MCRFLFLVKPPPPPPPGGPAPRAARNSDEVNLWAGQAHALAPELPAGELVATLAASAKTALETALSRRIQHC
ncbi:hypothetical protein [Nocardia abscessus]|uniref:hypothetical protein n=1 Tax=Nocardia abscessus TaxID=120957 RepID=UPI0024557EE5|nr:hypothetical protein [Nocardia abscessus]